MCCPPITIFSCFVPTPLSQLSGPEFEAARRSRLRSIFIACVAATLVMNLDGGGVPAALTSIQRTFHLQPWALGLLGALVYIGQATGALACGPLLKRYSPTRVCQAALLLNTLITLLFALSSSPAMLLVTRFFIGFLQSAPAVYFPVWVDEFGPDSRRTVWMAAIQAGAPLGIMSGYVIAGLLTQDETSTFGWRIPFLIQTGVLVLFSLLSPLLPKELFDYIQTSPKHSGISPAATSQLHIVSEADPSLEQTSAPTVPPVAPPDNEEDETLPAPLPSPASSIASVTAKQARGHRRTGSAEGLLASVDIKSAVATAAPSLPAVDEVEAGLPTPPPSDQAPSVSVIGRVSDLITRVPPGNLSEQATITGRARLESAGSVGTLLETALSADPPVRIGVGDQPGTPPAVEGTAAPDASADATPSSPPSCPSSSPPKTATTAGGTAGGTAGSEPSAAVRVISTRAAVKTLLRSRVYVSTCLAMTALFFVVTGIQFWVTAYLHGVLGAPKDMVSARPPPPPSTPSPFPPSRGAPAPFVLPRGGVPQAQCVHPHSAHAPAFRSAVRYLRPA